MRPSIISAVTVSGTALASASVAGSKLALRPYFTMTALVSTSGSSASPSTSWSSPNGSFSPESSGHTMRATILVPPATFPTDSGVSRTRSRKRGESGLRIA